MLDIERRNIIARCYRECNILPWLGKCIKKKEWYLVELSRVASIFPGQYTIGDIPYMPLATLMEKNM